MYGAMIQRPSSRKSGRERKAYDLDARRDEARARPRKVRSVRIVGGHLQYEGARRADECHEQIGVAVRAVVHPLRIAGEILGQALFQPDDAVEAERVTQRRLDLRAREVPVAAWMHDAAFRRDQPAGAVDRHGTPFEHKVDGVDFAA